MADYSIPHELTPNEAAGMTVNERLWVGLMDTFDEAIKIRDREKLRDILRQVYLNNSDIDAIIGSELDNL